MPDSAPSKQFERLVRAAIVSRLSQPDPHAISALRSELTARSIPTHGKARFAQARWAFAVGALIALVSIGLFIASSQAAAAVRHWLDFIPGLGLVDRSASWQALTEPVTQTRGGVALTVEAGSSDIDRTILLIKVEGMVPPLGAPSVGQPPACAGSPELVVDDQPLPGVGQRQETWNSGYTYRLVFPPMTGGKTEAELRIPCLLQVVPGAWPADWVVPLAFQPGEDQPGKLAYEPGLAMEGGTERQPPNAMANTAPPGPTPLATPSSLILDYGISSSLKGVVRQPDGLTLFGSTSWTATSILDFGIGVLPMGASLTDANGRDIPLEPTAPDDLPAPGDQRTAWAYRTSETDVAEPLTLTLHGFLIDLASGAEVNLDLGPDPQPGQTWSLDRHINLGQIKVRIVSAQLASDDKGGTDLMLTLQSNMEIVGASIFDRDHPEMGGGGGGGGVPEAAPEVIASVSYPEGLQANEVHLSIGRITILIDDTSSITWTDPTQ